MIFHLVRTNAEAQMKWILQPDNPESPVLLLRKLEKDLPMSHLGDVPSTCDKPHHARVVLDLLKMSTMYTAWEMQYFDEKVVRDSIHKIQDDFVYHSSKFAQNYLTMVKFHRQLDYPITPVSVLRTAQFLFACQGFKLCGEHQQRGRDIEVVMVEYASLAYTEAQLILAWETRNVNIPFHYKFFTRKVRDDGYTYGIAMTSLRSCLVPRNNETPGFYLHQSHDKERLYPRTLPLLARVQFPTGDKPRERLALAILETSLDMKERPEGLYPLQTLRNNDDENTPDEIYKICDFATVYTNVVRTHCGTPGIGIPGVKITPAIVLQTAEVIYSQYRKRLRKYENVGCTDDVFLDVKEYAIELLDIAETVLLQVAPRVSVLSIRRSLK